MIDNQESGVKTMCLGCVFAKGKLVGEDDTLQFFQDKDGCEHNVLARFREQGENIVDGTDEKKNEFHVIVGRTCPFYRPKIWLNDMGVEMDKAVKRARREVSVAPDVIIYFGKDHTTEDLKKTCGSIRENSLLPEKIYIANHTTYKPSTLLMLMQDLSFLPWRIETILEESSGVFRVLDIVSKKCESIFTTYFEAGFEVPSDFFSSLDKFVNDELKKFILLEPITGSINGLTVMRLFYYMAGGNKGHTIIEKAQKISEEQECKYLVRPVTEVITSL